jgi:hypothetical protein
MQGNKPFLVAVLFPFQINVYAFPCGAIVSFRFSLIRTCIPRPLRYSLRCHRYCSHCC